MITGADKVLIVTKGFEACHAGEAFIGRNIFSAMLLAEPGNSACRIGMAFSHIVVGELFEAAEILLSVLAENPDDAEARAFLDLALLLGGEGEQARQDLEKIKDSSPLAQGLLDEMNHITQLGL